VVAYDTSDRKAIRRAEKASRLAELNDREVMVAIASTTNGRRYLWNRLAECHLFTPIYNDNPQRMAFLEGERNAGLKLLSDFMQWCPEEFILAMREDNGRRDIDNSRSGNGRDDSDSPDPAASSERAGSEESGWDDQGSGDGSEAVN
jgi:hypothetical protein